MKKYESQRGYFAYELYKQMTVNPSVILLVGDLGFGMFDSIRDDYPKQFINCGASEQTMVDIAVGLALSGKIVFCYTITSFFMRAAETISLYLHSEQIPVKLVGSGQFNDYKEDGISHDATITQKYFALLDTDITYPTSKEEIPLLVEQMIKSKGPQVIFLER